MSKADADRYQPTTPDGKELRAGVTTEKWLEMVTEALDHAAVLRAVRRKRKLEGLSLRQSVEAVRPGLAWATYQYWDRLSKTASGELWERLLDRRSPPTPPTIAEHVRHSILALRRFMDPSMDCETARRKLRDQFGEEGNVSDRTLRRIWSAEGLTLNLSGSPKSVKLFHTGGALALLGAAAIETGAPLAMATAALEEARFNANAQPDGKIIVPDFEGRGEKGCFAPDYNHLRTKRRGPDKRDERWTSDEQKRQHRQLSTLALLSNFEATLAARIFALGVAPLITGRRGLQGLDGPLGGALELLGGHAYKTRTLQKTLAQLALLDVEDALWCVHATTLQKYAAQWTGTIETEDAAWRQIIVYIDTTQEPYWTRAYALSGKVSRVNKVMPCLSRIAINSGVGIPLIVETSPGTVSLKTQLPRLLERCDAILGEGEVARLTVIDAEIACGKILAVLKRTAATTGRHFITVLKGQATKTFASTTEFTGYKDRRDEIREGTVTLHGEGIGDAGLAMRAIEMRRPDSRHPHSTIYVTTADQSTWTTHQVVDAYLSRWPKQEHFFRSSRNGHGFNHTHGYGGDYIHHVAYETKLEKAERAHANAEQSLEKATVNEREIQTLQGALPAVQAAKAVAQRHLKQAERVVEQNKILLEEAQTTPREIFSRDPTRENIVTAATVMVVFLIEFVLQEYFKGLRMDARVFIENLVLLAVEVTTTKTDVTYRIEGNPRNEVLTDQLRAACQEVSSRKITRGNHLLIFEVVDPPGR